MRFKSLDELRKTKVGALAINDHLAPAQAPQQQPAPAPALVKSPKVRRRSQGRVVVRVAIISFSHHYVDQGNVSAGTAKALQDAIAHSLGVDDGDARIRWEYHPVQTHGIEGTLVKLDVL